jgi:hypothetical protein
MMSVMDDAERLRDIASSDAFPTGTLRHVQAQLNVITAEVAEILGLVLISNLGVSVTSEAVMRALETAIATCEEYKSSINDAADRMIQSGG